MTSEEAQLKLTAETLGFNDWKTFPSGMMIDFPSTMVVVIPLIKTGEVLVGYFQK